jgi:hypothetical protein
MTPEEPFDLTRSDEYQGEHNRVRVGGNIGTGVVLILCGIGFALVAIFSDAPWGVWVIAASFVVFGCLTTAYWYRAFRKSHPPS